MYWLLIIQAKRTSKSLRLLHSKASKHSLEPKNIQFRECIFTTKMICNDMTCIHTNAQRLKNFSSLTKHQSPTRIINPKHKYESCWPIALSLSAKDCYALACPCALKLNYLTPWRRKFVQQLYLCLGAILLKHWHNCPFLKHDFRIQISTNSITYQFATSKQGRLLILLVPMMSFHRINHSNKFYH